MSLTRPLTDPTTSTPSSSVKTIPEILGESRGLLLLVVAEADEVAGHGGGVPGDVEPGRAGQELVGVFTTAQKVDQALELRRVPWADVGGLTEHVLGILDTANEGVDTRIAEAGVDDDGAADGLAGRLQKH